jgi:hypothetical protein
MRGAGGEAVLILVKKRGFGLRSLRNKADAAGSARPKGKNAGLSLASFHVCKENGQMESWN